MYRVNKQDTNLEIEPNDLKNKMDSNQDVFLLDVRTPEEYETWRISYVSQANSKEQRNHYSLFSWE